MQPVTQNLRQPTSPTETAAPAAKLVSRRARNIIIGTLSGALGLGLAYGVGWAEGAARSKAIEQRVQAQKVGLQKNTGELREELTRAHQRANLLEARRFMHRSVMALELDNFGTAREHLAKAHALIVAEKPVPGSPLSELCEALVGIKLGVTADPMPLRLELTRQAHAFDQILDR